MSYRCGVCHKEVSKDLLAYIDHMEQHIVDEIKLKHPEWVGRDGVCQKCLDYYKKEIRGADGE